MPLTGLRIVRSGFIVFIPLPGLALGYIGLEILIILIFFLTILISYVLLKHMFKSGLITTLNRMIYSLAIDLYKTNKNENTCAIVYSL